MRPIIFAALLVLCAVDSAQALSDKPYTTLAQIDGIALLPPPPAADSVVQKRDLEEVLAVQKSRAPKSTARTA